MSKSFEVYPGSLNAPTFEAFRLRGEERIQQELGNRGIDAQNLRLTFRLLENKSNLELPLERAAPCLWGAEAYLWISVAGAMGGTDVTCHVVDDFQLEYWSSEIVQNARAKELKEKINACLSNNCYWSFRRSAGQPAIVNFAYGILAAVLAELTDGFVFSDDSAWDYERFPASSDEVYKWYFNPSLAIDTNFRNWAEECLARIASDLK
jgi:hypothetical protein